MANTIDARGLSCPQPLTLVMGALKKNPGPLTVLIDSQSSLESITRVLKKEKREVSISQNGEEITIEIGPLAN